MHLSTTWAYQCLACVAGLGGLEFAGSAGVRHADGVYDRINGAVIRYVLGYRRAMRPRIDTLIAGHGSRLQAVRLTGRRQVQRFLEELRPRM
ncbi:hypothetical protein GCM10022629_83820 [Amorphoplanes auranticolor]